MGIDLHTHTVYSDGTATPEELVALAAAAGLVGLALTDHDTTAGWERTRAACARHGLQFVPGIELSTEWTVAGEGVPPQTCSIHLLGYWVDPTDPALRTECERLRHARWDRGRRIVARLGELGVRIPWDAVAARAGGAPVGRPHIAAALIDAGVVPDVGTAFERYLADGGPAWVPKHAVTPTEGVALLRAAGGVAVLAHPALSVPAVADRDRPGNPAGERLLVGLTDELVAGGLAGIETDHAAHDETTVARWRRIAAERGLLATASSDFHGERKDVRLGARSTAPPVVEELEARGGRGPRPG